MRLLAAIALSLAPSLAYAACDPMIYRRCPCPEWCEQSYCERRCELLRQWPGPGGGYRCLWHCSPCQCGGIGRSELIDSADPDAVFISTAVQRSTETALSNQHGDFILAVSSSSSSSLSTSTVSGISIIERKKRADVCPAAGKKCAFLAETGGVCLYTCRFDLRPPIED